MIDQLRLLWNRPLRDGDRPRLFAIAVALIAAVAALLTILDRTTASTPPYELPSAPAVSSTPPTLTLAPAVATVVQRAPSEEGRPTAAPETTQAEVTASKRAARAFLAGYLPYTYGQRRASRIPAATAALRRELAARPPRVPARERRRHPRVAELQSDGVSPNHAAVSALVDDGHRRYSVALELARTRGRWLVTSLES